MIYNLLITGLFEYWIIPLIIIKYHMGYLLRSLKCNKGTCSQDNLHNLVV